MIMTMIMNMIIIIMIMIMIDPRFWQVLDPLDNVRMIPIFCTLFFETRSDHSNLGQAPHP